MLLYFKRLCWLGAICIPALQPLSAEPQHPVSVEARTQLLLNALDNGELSAATSGNGLILSGPNLSIEDCDGYPYSKPRGPVPAARLLLDDLRQGLHKGLRCLSGQGPQGELHPYHLYQAGRLLGILEAPQQKTFRCVEDAMFATAVATSPKGVTQDDALFPQLRQIEHPAVIFDTHRLGGFLSRKHDDQTYRSFFHLENEQIFKHRNGQPLRPHGLHRYQDRPSLVFHELIHWLGHEHSALQPDLAHLYETCCFGGSDYISDPARNSAHQRTACDILRDDELWNQYSNPYKRMRLWHYKGYDRLKTLMRSDYDS
jgi:hypothetical protein